MKAPRNAPGDADRRAQTWGMTNLKGCRLISHKSAFDTVFPSNEFASSRDAPGAQPATRRTVTRSNASPASSLRAPTAPTSARSPALGA